MKTEIFIARHGQTDYNKWGRLQGRGVDEPLNTAGRLQMRALTGYLKDRKIDLIVSSSLKRTVESARIVAEAAGVDILSVGDLDEMDFGIFEGRPRTEVEDDLEALHNRWMRGETGCPLPDGESPDEVLGRAKPVLNRIIGEQQGNTLLFILHGRLMRILLADMLNLGIHRMHEIEHSNGSVNHLLYNSGTYKAIYLNKTDHLNGPAGS